MGYYDQLQAWLSAGLALLAEASNAARETLIQLRTKLLQPLLRVDLSSE